MRVEHQTTGYGKFVLQSVLSLTTTLLLALAMVGQAFGSGFGRNGFSGNPYTNGGAVCTACHAPGASAPEVEISGPTRVQAGSTQSYSVTISGGPGASAGINVSVDGLAGNLTNIDKALHRIGQELSHVAPKPFQGSSVTFQFSWTAPDYNATLSMYAAGNSSNAGFDLLGDGISTDTLTINVHGGTKPPPNVPVVAPALKPTPFAAGLDRPVVIAHAGDERLFVVEQPGRIRVFDAIGKVAAAPFLDIGKAVDDSGNEQGLLGLAFHPDYANNGYFYVYYTYDPGRTPDRSRISRFRVSANPARANRDSERVLLEFEQPFANHNGGDLHFGPDGYLYIASGDGGGSGDPRNLALNDRVLLGKILRIDVNGAEDTDCSLGPARRYRTPAGNAYSDGPGGGCDEIYANGLRNPWRFSFDRQNGDLWIADVGQNAFEEINQTTALSGGGINFGWRCFEGKERFSADICNDIYLVPIHVLDHSSGNCSVTGGVVYRGFRYPNLYGRYLFSDFCNASIRTLYGTAAGWAEEEVTAAGLVNTPSAFGENAVGELFLASLNAGTVYRLKDTRKTGPIVGEAARIRLSQADSRVWTKVSLRNRYTEPVVVAGPPSSNGAAPVTVRVRRVKSRSFELQLDEWQYDDGRHASESVGYLIVEAGDHTLEDGTRFAAGRLAVDHRRQTVRFPQPFARTPVVLATVATARGEAAVAERIDAVTTSGFRVKLQEEEAADGRHPIETVHWVAIESGAGARQQTLGGVELGSAVALVPLGRGFNTRPVLLADLQTYRGADPVALRSRDANATAVSLWVEEEKSFDSEIRHVRERVGIAAFVRGLVRARAAPRR